ncbi:MAG: HAD hydrolase family protein [Gammaproteobacteria bacterium]
MRICIDLDGTICELKKEDQSYAEVQPKPGAREMIRKLRANGHTIIIYTARNMHTQNHNVGKVMKNVGKITLDWLAEHDIEYDEIFFGKPNAHITIDDRSIRFEGWDKLTENQIIELAQER